MEAAPRGATCLFFHLLFGLLPGSEAPAVQAGGPSGKYPGGSHLEGNLRWTFFFKSQTF